MRSKLLILSAAIATLTMLACNNNPYVQGQRIYEAKCATCHMSDGSGLESLIPPLAQADFLLKNQARIPCIIKHGLTDTILVNGTTFTTPMAGIDLSDVEITNVINYINHAWGNDLDEVTLKEVEKRLKGCETTPTR